MELIKIITAGLVGTLMMTLFSYVCGYLLSQEFGEPRLLNKLLNRSPWSHTDIEEDSPLGWGLHIAIGIVFAWIMYVYFVWTDTAPTWPIGGVLGFGLGVLGILGWEILLILHPAPPKLALPDFYLQLVVAHIVFALGTVLVFKVFERLI